MEKLKKLSTVATYIIFTLNLSGLNNFGILHDSVSDKWPRHLHLFIYSSASLSLYCNMKQQLMEGPIHTADFFKKNQKILLNLHIIVVDWLTWTQAVKEEMIDILILDLQRKNFLFI